MKLQAKYKEIVQNYAKMGEVIENRLKDFSKIKNKEDIFYELCFCLLTPQSNAQRCDEAVRILREKKLYSAHLQLGEIRKILQTRTRFHNNKGKYLNDLKGLFDTLWKKFDLENKSTDPFEVREWLVKNIKGLGLKEASHFLRNVGFRNLAILDRHILRNLQRLDVVHELPKTLTRNTYLLIEKNFLDFSRDIDIEVDKLDLYFWHHETGEVFK